MIKIVIDANLFASALIKPDSNPGQILELIDQTKQSGTGYFSISH